MDEDAISPLSSGFCRALGGTRIVGDRTRGIFVVSYNRRRRRAREGPSHGWRGDHGGRKERGGWTAQSVPGQLDGFT